MNDIRRAKLRKLVAKLAEIKIELAIISENEFDAAHSRVAATEDAHSSADGLHLAEEYLGEVMNSIEDAIYVKP
jgi:hypothetical protein